jgi:hypothetical protein
MSPADAAYIAELAARFDRLEEKLDAILIGARRAFTQTGLPVPEALTMLAADLPSPPRLTALEQRVAAHERMLLDALDEAGVPHPPRPRLHLISGGKQ